MTQTPGTCGSWRLRSYPADRPATPQQKTRGAPLRPLPHNSTHYAPAPLIFDYGAYPWDASSRLTPMMYAERSGGAHDASSAPCH